MYIKYDENKEITSIFIGCVPDNKTGYVEVPDDMEVMNDFIKKHDVPTENPEVTQEERIEQLEEALEMILSGVTE